MKLKTLLKDIQVEQVKGSRDVEITGICSNSKVVHPGDLFVAKKGLKADGNQFIGDAIEAGAHAVVTDIYDPSYKGIVQIISRDLVSIEGRLAAKFYAFPSEKLFTVGVTGTNGKTTVATLVKHLLERLSTPCGLLGTIEYVVGNHHYEATLTTSEVTTNHKLLKDMVSQGCKAAVMEASSHGLDQGRVNNIEFDAAIFTNLSQDHLDYHGSMEAYGAAKRRLFTQLDASNKKDKVAIVNGDDPWASKMVEGCGVKTIRYGFGQECSVRAFMLNPSSFEVSFEGEKAVVDWQLVGRHNVYNGLAALALGLHLGKELSLVCSVLSGAPITPGRLEPVANDRGVGIYVDFAHTPDALEKVLQSLRESTQGKVITVFGCGGNRDSGKRPLMGSVAQRFSDHTIITSDNPRTEDPEKIIEEIEKGFTDSSRFTKIADRKSAMEAALVMADRGDVVLIAGKGHEKRQIFAHQTLEFDDFLVAKELLGKL